MPCSKNFSTGPKCQPLMLRHLPPEAPFSGSHLSAISTSPPLPQQAEHSTCWPLRPGPSRSGPSQSCRQSALHEKESIPEAQAHEQDCLSWRGNNTLKCQLKNKPPKLPLRRNTTNSTKCSLRASHFVTSLNQPPIPPGQEQLTPNHLHFCQWCSPSRILTAGCIIAHTQKNDWVYLSYNSVDEKSVGITK